jgi:hypothetical protein
MAKSTWRVSLMVRHDIAGQPVVTSQFEVWPDIDASSVTEAERTLLQDIFREAKQKMLDVIDHHIVESVK